MIGRGPRRLWCDSRWFWTIFPCPWIAGFWCRESYSRSWREARDHGVEDLASKVLPFAFVGERSRSRIVGICSFTFAFRSCVPEGMWSGRRIAFTIAGVAPRLCRLSRCRVEFACMPSCSRRKIFQPGIFGLRDRNAYVWADT